MSLIPLIFPPPHEVEQVALGKSMDGAMVCGELRVCLCAVLLPVCVSMIF